MTKVQNVLIAQYKRRAQCFARTQYAYAQQSTSTNPNAKNGNKTSSRNADAEPVRRLVAAACPFPPLLRALATAVPVTLWLRVVVAGNNAVVVL
jgi:hypothetical protein